MSHQFINPINKKLAKYSRKNEIKVLTTEQDKTPIKTANRHQEEYLKNKQNIGTMPFDNNPNNLFSINSSSLRKISFLEKKSSRKDMSIDFFRQQLSRRKQKYENQLISIEEQFQAQIAHKQQMLINDMKQQYQLDRQIAILQLVQSKVKGVSNTKQSIPEQFVQIKNLDIKSLFIFDQEVSQQLSKYNQQNGDDQLTYTLDTLTHHLKDSIQNRQDSFLEENFQNYFTSKL